ncbi:MAG: ankyrin repeat domain-containing protein, partial [Fuerstiella sp.]
DRPNFAQLRKQAKELLKSYLVGQHAAVIEVEQYERNPDSETFALVDAQRVLARAYGFRSWTRLKQHVDGMHVRAFCDSADAGDVTTVRKLAKARPELVNIERGGEFGERIALHFAVLNRDAEMTRVLMELGSDARKGVWPHRDASAAYTIASDRGDDEIVAIIQQQEERRRQELSSAGSSISPKTDEVHNAIREDRCDVAIRILKSDLSLVGACSNYGVTPLHVAAVAHNPDMVRWLLDHHAPVDPIAPFDVASHLFQVNEGPGKTPLDFAAIIAGWSSHGRDFACLENSRIEPAQFHETVRLLRSSDAVLTPRAAVAIGDQRAVEQMQHEGRLNNDIHFFRGGLLSIAVRVNRIEMVSLLLDLGLDPDESAAPVEDGGRSWGMPLWFAAMCGRHEIAKLLLDRRADVNAIVYACGDALGNANGTGDEKMKALLLEHGARVTVENVADQKDRETAKAILDGAIPGRSLNCDDPSHTELAEQLLWAAGRSDSEIVRMCLPHVKREGDDRWWNYVLMHATLPDSFKSILEHGVDPDVVGEGGYTTLHHLATNDVRDLNGVTFAAMLLDAGASLRQRDPLLNSTPLGWACRWGRIELATLYLERGADPIEPRAEKWATPMAWAAKGGHREITELLHSSGAK